MMKEEISIGFIELRDIPSVVKLIRTSFNESHLVTSIYKCKGIECFLETEINNEYSAYKYFVVKIADEIVGYAEFKLFYESSTAFLNMIATSNIYKGKGIAKTLINFSLDYFRKLDFSNVQLDVFDSNTIAKKWYEGIGFSSVESNYMYKLETIKKEEFNKQMTISNIGQFKCLFDKFGFSYLQLIVDTKSVNLGVIENSFILKGDLLPKSIIKKLQLYFKEYNFLNSFYIGKELKSDDIVFVDLIHRMKLLL